MLKKYLLLLAATLTTGSMFAQDVKPCGADEMRRKIIAEHPEILQIEAQMEQQLKEGLKKFDFTKAAKTTTTDESGNPDFWYDIPIVVHIVHDYNAFNTSTFAGDYIPDDFIFDALDDWNIVEAKRNADTSDVILPFKKYIGNPHIRLHLATIDPNGNPTKGITRRRNYLTYLGGQQSKFDDWDPTSYVNIWSINKMSTANGSAAAYAHYPSTAAVIPYYDGVIALASYMNNGSKTIPHELGHVFNLMHVWGDNNQPGVECGDDNVDDTPPTKGHNPSGCAASAIYDTNCSINYFKIYTDTAGHITLVDYPDTNNSQNIMDYTYCDRMFTIGQVERMHAALNSDVAGRNHLWDTSNLIATGALLPRPDLKPIPDFIATPITGGSNYINRNANFCFPGKDIKITNQTWNDTLTALEWTFTNGASVPSTNSTTSFNNQFADPGWVTVTMKATGNNSGDTTVVFPGSIFVADNAGVNVANGYFQEFSADGDRAKWPFFNYYNNEFKWDTANVGVDDHSCMKYSGYDERMTSTVYPFTGSPQGDFDDMYSVPVDLTSWGTSNCNLNFYYSGASRSSVSSSITDSLSIEYSVNKSNAWTTLKIMSKGSLCNKGAMSTPYTPSSIEDWAAATIPLPAAAITPYTVFRFRYRPGVGANGYSSGNNFYLDRIHFTPWTTGVADMNIKGNVAVLPNPTHDDAYVVVKSTCNSSVQIAVTDITGKTVYSTSQNVSNGQARIQIPAANIAVKGLYLVHVTSGSVSQTEKLVVY